LPNKTCCLGWTWKWKLGPATQHRRIFWWLRKKLNFENFGSNQTHSSKQAILQQLDLIDHRCLCDLKQMESAIKYEPSGERFEPSSYDFFQRFYCVILERRVTTGATLQSYRSYEEQKANPNSLSIGSNQDFHHITDYSRSFDHIRPR